MSESGRSHLGLVVGRWIQVNNIIERYKTTIPALQSFKTNQFLPRFHRQVNDMHWAAHFLMPKHATSDIILERQQSMFKFLQRYTNDNRFAILRSEFFAFRNKTGLFAPTAACWQDTDNPLLFWQTQGMFGGVLARLAVRLLSTPANSVPSERSFSAQNLIHSQKRNRLQAERVNKLTFIHMNQRLLNAIKDPTNHHYPPGNDEELAMENEFLQENDVVLLSENVVETDSAQTLSIIGNELDATGIQLLAKETDKNDGLDDMVLDENVD